MTEYQTSVILQYKCLVLSSIQTVGISQCLNGRNKNDEDNDDNGGETKKIIYIFTLLMNKWKRIAYKHTVPTNKVLNYKLSIQLNGQS